MNRESDINDVDVIMAGGGIGGLANALALALTGQRVRVLERSSEFAEVGAGLQMAPNATRILRQWGLLEKVSAAGVSPRRLVFRDAIDGSVLTSAPLGAEFFNTVAIEDAHCLAAEAVSAPTSAAPTGSTGAVRQDFRWHGRCPMPIPQTRCIVFLSGAAKEPTQGKAALSMFERFTDRARRVVVLAQEEARMFNHEYVGTEHILLALIREGGGVAAKALESLGITEEAARQQVEEVVGPGQTGPKRGHLPFTPRAKKTLQLSLREAIALGHAYIGTEHILLGLVRMGEGPAMQVLNGLGVDPNRVRQQVIQQVSARRVQEEPGTGRATGRGKRKLLPELRGRLDCLEWRLSVLEQRVGTAPDMGQLDQEISQVRRDKENAVDTQDFENAAVLRDREQQLLGDKAARLQEWAALPSLSDEVERLRDLLRRHGIDPQDGAA